ncbi:MAG: molybdopterin molybdotransferase MoeA [Actinobacteria bacterium]|nr:molybdopterin molybdotransferase MoeA [Actinomycetota bacterium]
MIPRSVALQFVLDSVSRLDVVDVGVNDAAGLVLAENVTAMGDVPPFANSAMDGIAVHAAETDAGATFRLVGTVAAGDTGALVVGPGEAARIMTGAPVPAGADAVVMVEDCTFDEGADGETVTIEHRVEPGTSIRPTGDDLSAGAVVMTAGTVISPGGLALLRTAGRARVKVVRRPVVGVMSTGDELVEPPAALERGQIYDSNRAAIIGLVRENGFQAVDLGCIRDDEAALEAALRDGAARCDAVLSTGGVSMGDFDLVKAVLARIAEMRWMQIAIKPAKPFAFGTLRVDPSGDDGAHVDPDGAASRAVPIFGLPGNPISSMVSFELFALAGLRAMAGWAEVERPTVRAVAAEAFRRRSDGKEHFPRIVVSVGLDGRLHARSAGGQGSHQLAAMAFANAIAVLPDGEGVAAGDPIDVRLTGLLARS